MRSWPTLGVSALLLAFANPAVGATDALAVERAVAAAERRWDADAAVAALNQARALARLAPSPTATALHLRAGLLAAELLRVRFEQTPQRESATRETLGAQIDAIASEALALVETGKPTSERYRVEADLVATLIRSDFRAKKYETRLKAAIARARELDPRNPLALISAAKPLLFAPPEHGRDLAAGIALLDQALALDPRLESALLLRAFAHDALGDRTAAETDWRATLRLNPDCAPAKAALATR